MTGAAGGSAGGIAASDPATNSDSSALLFMAIYRGGAWRSLDAAEQETCVQAPILEGGLNKTMTKTMYKCIVTLVQNKN